MLRHYSLSDRIRYYWASRTAERAVAGLLEALSGRLIPPPLLWQHMPEAQGFADKPLDPSELLIWRVRKSLAAYHSACRI